MTSPINHINRSVTDALSNNTKTRTKSATTENANQVNRPASEDTISLSEQTLQVKELQQQLEKVPEVDSDKVKAIKQAIARGEYPLDPAKIASNLINLEKALSE